ncbi:MAG: hypothetical protein AAGA48_08340 [Myxococcota bacterium]
MWITLSAVLGSQVATAHGPVHDELVFNRHSPVPHRVHLHVPGRTLARTSKRKGRPVLWVLGLATVTVGTAAVAVGGSLTAVNGSWWLESRQRGLFVVRDGVIVAANDDAADELRQRRRAQKAGQAILAAGIGTVAIGSSMMVIEPTRSGTGLAARWTVRW